MIITLIGMSGVGKSYWATKLAERGFTAFDCDALIADRLQERAELPGVSLADIGRWMGFPYEPGFQHREALYLTCETETLREILDRLQDPLAPRGDYVIDTSGSVVYAEPALLRRLAQQSTVVYFQIPETVHERMLGAYLEQPRPIIWNGLFRQSPDEDLRAAFQRSYTELIRNREQLYEQYSHILLDYSEYRGPDIRSEQLLERIISGSSPDGVRAAR